MIEEKDKVEENLDISLKPKKLIDIDYSYENLINNPIIKPISEADGILKNLMEMSYKKFLDAKKDKDFINKGIESIPAYQTSNMVGRLIKFNSEVEDIIKLQNLQLSILRECIKEMFNLVMEKYGVYKEEKKEVKQINYFEYLNSLLERGDNSDCIELIIAEYENQKEIINEKKRFELSCANVYSKEEDKNKKTIIAKIMRMEYWKEGKWKKEMK